MTVGRNDRSQRRLWQSAGETAVAVLVAARGDLTTALYFGNTIYYLLHLRNLRNLRTTNPMFEVPPGAA